MKIVVAMPVTEEHKKWLNAAAGDYPVYFADNQVASWEHRCLKILIV